MSDRDVRSLLDCFPGLLSWKRQVDVKAGGVPKTFGFADWSSPRSVLLVKSLLNDLLLGDSKLLVKVDEKNQKMVDEWSSQNAAQAPDEAERAKLREQLLKLAADINAALGFPTPSSVPHGSTSSPSVVASQSKSESNEASLNVAIPSTASTTSHAHVSTATPLADNAPRDLVHAPKKMSSLEAKRVEERRKDLERKLEAIEEDKELERRRIEKNEKTYRSIERALEGEQRERRSQIERRKRVADEAHSRREEALRAENALLWSSEEAKNGNAGQREAVLRRALMTPERVKLRLREKEQDELDRQEEESDLRAEMRRAEERHKEEVRMQQEEQAQRMKQHQQLATSMVPTSSHIQQLPPLTYAQNDKKRAAQQDIEKSSLESSGQAKSAKVSEDHSSPHTFTIGSTPSQQTFQSSATQKQATSAHQPPAAQSAAATFASRIPSDSASLFATPIRWDLIDQHKLLEKKIRPWVVKKIIEYLEVEEPTMIQFICTHIKEHKPAKELIAQLQPVLDEETEVFVITLWRMLVLESLRMEAGHF